MKSLSLVIVSLFAFNAFAARQKISCTEVTRAKAKGELTFSFDPDVQLTENWSKGTKGDQINGYENGTEDKKDGATGTTTARLAFTPSDSAAYKLSGYYEVNVVEKSGGYKDHFNGQAYRTAHGYDRKETVDLMFYYPDAVVGKAAKDFKALVTYQPAYMDEGYYNVDMICDSTVK